MYQKREENIVFFAFRSIVETSPRSILPPTELQKFHFHSQKGKHTGNNIPPKDPVNRGRPGRAPGHPTSQLQTPADNPHSYRIMAPHR